MIVLDTHAWIWWVADRARLGKAARRTIESDTRRAISDISLWELATLLAKGRIRLDRDPREWMEQAISTHAIEIIPIRPDIAIRSTQLGRGFQGDPADRLIVATALLETAPLVTKDARIRAFPGVTSVW